MIKFSNQHMAGYLPQMLSAHDPRPAVEQLDSGYAHGGGWQPFYGFTLVTSGQLCALRYPGDPDTQEIARGKLRDELIVLFQFSWVAVIQPDGSYEIARMD